GAAEQDLSVQPLRSVGSKQIVQVQSKRWITSALTLLIAGRQRRVPPARVRGDLVKKKIELIVIGAVRGGQNSVWRQASDFERGDSNWREDCQTIIDQSLQDGSHARNCQGAAHTEVRLRRFKYSSSEIFGVGGAAIGGGALGAMMARTSTRPIVT